jgi:hypothetical protein
MTVTAAGASLEFDCASGTVDEPIVPRESGRFDARGTYIPGKGGPAIEGEESVRHLAIFEGQTDGKTMTLRVRLSATRESLGRFVLSKGAPARVFRCL